MRVVVLAVTIALAIGGVAAGSKADLDAKNGFRDATFGSPLSSFEGMALSEDSGRRKYYRRGSDSMKIGEAELTSIVYGFYDDAFSGVMIRAEGFSDCLALQRALEESYGKGYQSNRYIKKYYWHGSKVTMSFDVNEPKDTCTAWMAHVPTLDKMKADEKAAAAEAKKDL